MDIKSHTCPVIEVRLEPHPNADSLSIVRIDDFQVVVKTSDWKNGDLGIYIEPDSVAPKTEKFAFLGDHNRIKVRKFRGEYSMGLLIRAPADAKIGDDYMESLGVTHYNPPINMVDGENTNPPKIFAPDYDILNFRKYSKLFLPDEEVIVTEKIHGTSSRYVCHNDVMYCGSHHNWKKETDNNAWWQILKIYPVLDAWCRHHQGFIVYGEIYGRVQNLKYGTKDGEIRFAVFDLMKDGRWLDYDEAQKIGRYLPWVPLVYRGPFCLAKIFELAEGDSLIPGANHYREGVVIKPIKERTDPNIGRVQLKLVSNQYLSK